MAIVTTEDSVEALLESTGSKTRANLASQRMFSGSASEDTWGMVGNKDMYYTLVEIKERVDEFGNLTNIMSASIDGGTF